MANSQGDKQKVRAILDAVKKEGRDSLTAPEGKQICDAYGINVPKETVVASGPSTVPAGGDPENIMGPGKDAWVRQFDEKAELKSRFKAARYDRAFAAFFERSPSLAVIHVIISACWSTDSGMSTIRNARFSSQ